MKIIIFLIFFNISPSLFHTKYLIIYVMILKKYLIQEILGGIKMHKPIGPYIREIRKEKGLSLLDLCDYEITKSALSKFERGESNINVSAFLTLLSNLGITFEEFDYRINSYNSTSIYTLVNKIKQAYISNNSNLLNLIKLEEQKNGILKRKCTQNITL